MTHTCCQLYVVNRQSQAIHRHLCIVNGQLQIVDCFRQALCVVGIMQMAG